MEYLMNLRAEKKLIGVFLFLVLVVSSGCSSEDVTQFPVSNALYGELNTEVGCGSQYSDDKKTDVFNSKYKNHWMTWRGEVVDVQTDRASLKVDRMGFLQDLRVEFIERNAGYNLTKGSFITVKFVMRNVGGCFLPFGGDNATVLKN
jgi:hypothetical protein